MSIAEENWQKVPLVAFDTETTGKYPLEAEICEIAAVKWLDGKIIDQFQTLLKPSRPMGDEVIAIHHITNDMVASAPLIKDRIGSFYDFIKGSVLIAHHAPFDLGFLAIEFEKAKLPLPENKVLCSSLLSRKAIPESPNHRLQTLIQHLRLEQGQAHRALDDAKACLDVTLTCLKRIGEGKTMEQVWAYQGLDLYWRRYSMADLRGHEVYGPLVKAIEMHSPIQIVYQGGSRKGQARTVMPKGLVRNSQQDFLVASEGLEEPTKRYFLDKITKAII